MSFASRLLLVSSAHAIRVDDIPKTKTVRKLVRPLIEITPRKRCHTDETGRLSLSMMPSGSAVSFSTTPCMSVYFRGDNTTKYRFRALYGRTFLVAESIVCCRHIFGMVCHCAFV